MNAKRWAGLLVVGLLASSASANLRMARKVDGVFSGLLKPGLSAGGIRLLAEDLEAVFPDLDLSQLSYRDTLRFKVVYVIENLSDRPVSVPVRFIAVDLSDLTAELDGRPLAVKIVESPLEKAECLERMTRHRDAFLPVFYSDFLERVRAESSPDTEPAERRPSASLFVRTLESPPEMDFPAAEFEIPLPPGKSRLVVSYRQRLAIDERNNGYFAAWPKKGVTGFDYLLYPARTWEMDPGFRLRLTIEVPDARRKRFFFKSWQRPSVKCNLPLREEAGRTKNVRLFKGEFADMPSDVLTFLLWVDRSAAAYVR